MKFKHEKHREAQGLQHFSPFGEMYTCGLTEDGRGQKLVAVLRKGRMIWVHKDFQK